MWPCSTCTCQRWMAWPWRRSFGVCETLRTLPLVMLTSLGQEVARSAASQTVRARRG